MSAAVVERWTTAGTRKALRFAPHITLSRESKGCRVLAFKVASDSTQTRKTNCAYCRRYMSVAKARARHSHNSGPLQVSKASLEVRDFPTDGEGQGSSQ